MINNNTLLYPYSRIKFIQLVKELLFLKALVIISSLITLRLALVTIYARLHFMWWLLVQLVIISLVLKFIFYHYHLYALYAQHFILDFFRLSFIQELASSFLNWYYFFIILECLYSY